MPAFFAFSDETGSYDSRPSDAFLQTHPYYIRATYLIAASGWKSLNRAFLRLKDKAELPHDRELKWSYIWSLYKHRQAGEPVTPDKDYYFLRDWSERELVDFVGSSLELLGKLDYCKALLTVTNNHRCRALTKPALFRMHIQEAMQRVEMELQNDEENLGVFFLDPTSHETNRFLRETYFELFREGDFIERYSHIKDSLNIEHSHHSVGIQLADYLSGCFAGFLKGFGESTNLFRKRGYPLLRRSRTGEILGYGIREVPRNDTVRRELRSKLEQTLAP